MLATRCHEESGGSTLQFLCWNIRNPSLQRAQRQARWLREQSGDLLVLTECRDNEGSAFLRASLGSAGYQVVFRPPQGNEYGVIIASRYSISQTSFCQQVGFLPSRVISAEIRDLAAGLEIIGLYVPSRDSSPEKIARKRRFLAALRRTFKEIPRRYRIVCGDLNILEPDHVPRYPVFQDWEYDFYRLLPEYRLRDAFRQCYPHAREYSWVGRTGNGYRYDHFFVSGDLLPALVDCRYVHEPRLDGLSDHSALVALFSRSEVERIVARIGTSQGCLRVDAREL